MRPYWVSWYGVPDVEICLHSPWWLHSVASEQAGQPIYVGAIMAWSQDDLFDKLFSAHDYDNEEPFGLRLRFIREMPHGWTPFGPKRPRADWMVWPSKPH